MLWSYEKKSLHLVHGHFVTSLVALALALALVLILPNQRSRSCGNALALGARHWVLRASRLRKLWCAHCFVPPSLSFEKDIHDAI
jgi:hypothetical protein